MLRRRGSAGNAEVRWRVRTPPSWSAIGFGHGLFSGFFGIGGGFLIVPGLIAATGMPMINAVGSSLVAVTAFGLTTAANYAFSGLVDWPLALAFIAGGLGGGIAGTRRAGTCPPNVTHSRSYLRSSSSSLPPTCCGGQRSKHSRTCHNRGLTSFRGT